jgi:hypothetical protein
MPPMKIFDRSREQGTLLVAFAVSLAIHLAVLLAPRDERSGDPQAVPRLEARLAPSRKAAEPAVESPSQPSASKTAKAKPQTRILTADKSRSATPQWSVAQKAEMDGFLNELAEQAKSAPKPTLAQRSLAMAREAGRELARQDATGDALLELRPNGPPVNPFSLELYLDGLVRRLNRSAGFVNNERRHRGVQTAAVQFRLNPDGSLKSFVVLNAGDQADEVAFIKAVIERSVPFSPFPPDIDRAARSLGITICIRPGQNNEPGFSRMSGSRCV